MSPLRRRLRQRRAGGCFGWLFHRTKGGLVAGTLFVLPGRWCLPQAAGEFFSRHGAVTNGVANAGSILSSALAEPAFQTAP